MYLGDKMLIHDRYNKLFDNPVPVNEEVKCSCAFGHGRIIPHTQFGIFTQSKQLTSTSL